MRPAVVAQRVAAPLGRASSSSVSSPRRRCAGSPLRRAALGWFIRSGRLRPQQGRHRCCARVITCTAPPLATGAVFQPLVASLATVDILWQEAGIGGLSMHPSLQGFGDVWRICSLHEVSCSLPILSFRHRASSKRRKLVRGSSNGTRNSELSQKASSRCSLRSTGLRSE